MAVQFPTGDPYRLPGKRIVFTNWHWVRACGFAWVDREGRGVSVVGDQDAFGARIQHHERPYGLRLKSLPAARSAPFLKAEKPWEDGHEVFVTILQDGGRYRAWGMVGGWGDLKDRGEPFFCYFESDNGYDWKRPDCGVLDFKGAPKTNLLARAGGTVFADPSAPPGERYKWVSERHFNREEFEAFVRRRPGAVDSRCIRKDAGLYVGVQGAVSPDGLRWQVLPEPLVMTHSDTQVVVYYDLQRRTYVGYFRDWAAGPLGDAACDASGVRWLGVGRRCIGRAESADFRAFPLPEVLVEPRLDMSPNDVLYTSCKTTIPGAPDQHLMFPAVWDQAADTTRIEVLSSSDGVCWNWIPGGPVLDTAPFGQWDGGCVFAVPNLIELPDGDFALPYTGYNVPHKYPRKKATRSTAYALWPKGRIVGLEAAGDGGFTTPALIAPGRRLLLNAVIARAGHVCAEVCDLNGRAIPGRGFGESVPLFGDCHRAPVVWKEHGDLGIPAGQPVVLRFRMSGATIYGLDFD